MPTNTRPPGSTATPVLATPTGGSAGRPPFRGFGFVDFLSGINAPNNPFLPGALDVNLSSNSTKRALGLAASQTLPFFTQGAQTALPLGMAGLSQILASQGQTDPRLFNQQLAAISQGGQSRQMDLEGALARMGLQSSGLGRALSSATGQSTENRLASARGQEARLAEQRRRSDVMNALQLLLGTSLGAAGQKVNLVAANSSGGSGLGALLGTAGTVLGSIYGGPAGGAAGGAAGSAAGEAIQ
jgi:hypothetical protein